MTCRRCADDMADDARMTSRSNLNPVHCVSENIACADGRGQCADDDGRHVTVSTHLVFV